MARDNPASRLLPRSRTTRMKWVTSMTLYNHSCTEGKSTKIHNTYELKANMYNLYDPDDITVLSWKNLSRGPGDVNMPLSGKMATGCVTQTGCHERRPG